MPGGKWGVEVREEIAGNHYVTGAAPSTIHTLKNADRPQVGGAGDSFS